jgi:Tfp pilus assembly protein PilF
MPTLKALIAAEDQPGDYELLGLCEVRAGDEAAARKTFQRGLDLERARDPQSPLCGQLMKWVASV